MNTKNSIFGLIHRDHVNMLSLLIDAEKSDDPGDRLLQLTEEIKNHGAVVDTVIIPTLRKVMRRERVGEFARQEQAKLTECAERLCSMSYTDEAWKRDFTDLKKRLNQHVNRLERRLFKKMKRLLDKKELNALSTEYMGVRSGVVERAA